MIAGSYGKSLFSFIRNHKNVFQSGCTMLHSHQQWMRVPVAPHPYQHLMLSVFWILTILIGIYYLIVVLSYIFLKTYDVKHLFICLFAICISSLVKCLLRSLAHIFTGMFSFFNLFWVLCIFWIIALYQMCSLQIFSPSLCLVFSFSCSIQFCVVLTIKMFRLLNFCF